MVEKEIFGMRNFQITVISYYVEKFVEVLAFQSLFFFSKLT